MANPKLIEKIKYKSCLQINDTITNKRYYLTPEGEKLPSVTTILSSTKDNTHLDQWRQRVGEQNAAQIVKEASDVGTLMHAELEKHVQGINREKKTNHIHLQAYKMANVIIDQGLSKIDEFLATEQSLYFPGLYAGTTDLIATYQGNLSIIDFKQSNKLKKKEWVEDYKLQLVSYALAHNEVYDTNINEGHIFMCTRDLKYQQFDLWPDEFTHYRNLWIDRVEQYYIQS